MRQGFLDFLVPSLCQFLCASPSLPISQFPVSNSHLHFPSLHFPLLPLPSPCPALRILLAFLSAQFTRKTCLKLCHARAQPRLLLPHPQSLSSHAPLRRNQVEYKHNRIDPLSIRSHPLPVEVRSSSRASRRRRAGRQVLRYSFDS